MIRLDSFTLRYAFLLALLLFGFNAPNLLACDDVGVGVWDWSRCYSLTRLLLWAGTCFLAWWFSMEMIFPMLLDYLPGRTSLFSSIIGLVLVLLAIDLIGTLLFSYFGFTYGWRNVTHLSADGRPVSYLVWHENVEWASMLALLWFSAIVISLPVIAISLAGNYILPRAAFAWSIAIFLFLVVAAFDFFFGAIGDDLRFTTSRFFPAQWVWLNIHWKWLGMLMVAVLVSGITYLALRGPREASV